VPPPLRALPHRAVGPRRACASLVASFAAGVGVWNVDDTGVRIATFRCAAPARCGAFAEERRVVIGDGGGAQNTEECGPGSVLLAFWCARYGGRAGAAGSRFSPCDPVHELERDNRLLTPMSSLPPSVAPRPRVAARSSMSGVSLPVREAAKCARETIIHPLGSQSPAVPCPRAGLGTPSHVRR
jgi:hypothetical protein